MSLKRGVLIVIGLLVVLILGIGSLVAATFMGRRPMVDGTVVRSARIVIDGIVGVAVLPIGSGQVALVDAGNDAEGTAILSELSRRGLTADAVAAVLLTHGHGDHIAAAGRFPKATVMALEDEVALVEGREGPKGPVTRLFPVGPTGITVSRRLRDGEVFTLGDVQVRAFAVPGHTGGSAAYLIDKVLFVGDSADADSDGRLEGAPWIFSDSQSQNRQSLSALARRLRAEALEVEAIVPAHSGVLTDGVRQLEAFATAVGQ